MGKIFFTIFSVVIISGCAGQKMPMSAIGGSKADGTVRMGYSYGPFVVPNIDMQQTQKLASERCKVWGYTGADAFGGQVRSCSMMGAYGCEQTTVHMDYQCTGG